MHDDVTFETRLADALRALCRTGADHGRRRRRAPGHRGRRVGRAAAGCCLCEPARLASGAGRPMLRVAYLLIVLALVLAAILASSPGAHSATIPSRPIGRNGAIAFTVQGNDHGPAGTHLMNADGTGDRPIDAGRCPTYSRDGSVLASLSYDGSAFLVIRDADGDHVQRGAPRRRRARHRCPTPCPRRDPGRLVQAGGATVGDVELWVAPVDRWPGGIRVVPGVERPGTRSQRRRSGHPMAARIAFGTYVGGRGHGRAASIGDLRRRRGRSGSAPAHDPAGLARRRDVVVTGWPIPRLRRRAGRARRSHSSGGEALRSRCPPATCSSSGPTGSGDLECDEHAGARRTQPEWSPDGTALAFETSADGEAHRLTTIRMNGPTPAAGRPRSRVRVVRLVAGWDRAALARGHHARPRDVPQHHPLDRPGIPPGRR